MANHTGVAVGTPAALQTITTEALALAALVAPTNFQAGIAHKGRLAGPPVCPLVVLGQHARAFKVVDALVLEQQFVVLANVARCKKARLPCQWVERSSAIPWARDCFSNETFPAVGRWARTGFPFFTVSDVFPLATEKVLVAFSTKEPGIGGAFEALSLTRICHNSLFAGTPRIAGWIAANLPWGHARSSIFGGANRKPPSVETGLTVSFAPTIDKIGVVLTPFADSHLHVTMLAICIAGALGQGHFSDGGGGNGGRRSAGVTEDGARHADESPGSIVCTCFGVVQPAVKRVSLALARHGANTAKCRALAQKWLPCAWGSCSNCQLTLVGRVVSAHLWVRLITTHVCG